MFKKPTYVVFFDVRHWARVVVLLGVLAAVLEEICPHPVQAQDGVGGGLVPVGDGPEQLLYGLLLGPDRHEIGHLLAGRSAERLVVRYVYVVAGVGLTGSGGVDVLLARGLMLQVALGLHFRSRVRVHMSFRARREFLKFGIWLHLWATQLHLCYTRVQSGPSGCEIQFDDIKL